MQLNAPGECETICLVEFHTDDRLGRARFLGEVAGVGSYEEVKKNSDVMTIFERDCLILSLEGLIRSKKAAGRERDLEVLPELEGLLDLRKRSQK